MLKLEIQFSYCHQIEKQYCGDDLKKLLDNVEKVIAGESRVCYLGIANHRKSRSVKKPCLRFIQGNYSMTVPDKQLSGLVDAIKKAMKAEKDCFAEPVTYKVSRFKYLITGMSSRLGLLVSG